MKSKNPVARFDVEQDILIDNIKPSKKELTNGFIINDVLSINELDALYKIYEKQEKIPVGIDGIVSHYKKGEDICSYRATMFSKTISEKIFNRIKGFIPEQKGYKAIGINESFRFIDYKNSGVLIPHYDGEYKRNEEEVSLLTMVIYLMAGEKGRTQFIKETRDSHNFEDWERMAFDNEIIETALNKKGSALIFPHRTLHQGEKVNGRKIIIRTDIMFRKI